MSRYRSILRQSCAPAPDPSLPRKIVAQIERRERRAAVRHAALFGVSDLAAIAFVAYAGKSLVESISESGLYQFLALGMGEIISSGSLKELVLSVAEGLPLAGMSVGLAALAFLVWSSWKTTMAYSHYKISFSS